MRVYKCVAVYTLSYTLVIDYFAILKVWENGSIMIVCKCVKEVMYEIIFSSYTCFRYCRCRKMSLFLFHSIWTIWIQLFTFNLSMPVTGLFLENATKDIEEVTYMIPLQHTYTTCKGLVKVNHLYQILSPHFQDLSY